MQEIFKEIAWRAHIPGLIGLSTALVLLICSVLVYLDQLTSLKQAEDAYRQQRTINLGANESQQLLESYLIPYQALRGHGVIGSAKRLQWIEVAQKLGDRFHVPLLEYTLDGAVRVTDSNNIYWNAELDIQMTPMELEMQLHHEGEFFHLLNELQAQSEGLFSVERCDLRRRPTNAN